MPFCPTNQEFWQEYIVGLFERKLTDRIFGGPREKWKIIQKEKKILVKFCTKMPLVPTGQKFRKECNVSVFA